MLNLKPKAIRLKVALILLTNNTIFEHETGLPHLEEDLRNVSKTLK